MSRLPSNIAKLQRRAWRGAEVDSTVEGTFDGHDIRYKLSYLGSSGLVFETPWFYEGWWVDDTLTGGKAREFTPDHKPMTEGVRSNLRYYVRHAEGEAPLHERLLASPTATPESEASAGWF